MLIRWKAIGFLTRAVTDMLAALDVGTKQAVTDRRLAGVAVAEVAAGASGKENA